MAAKKILTKQEKYLKHYRKISNRLDEINLRRDDLFNWIPVKKPQFIGWETSIQLSQSALYRSDASKLLSVLQIFNASNPIFTKDTWIVKLIRRNNKRFSSIKADYFKFKPEYICIHDIKDITAIKITDKCFEKLDANLKVYFTEYSDYNIATIRRDAYVTKYYKLDHTFPIYELRVKIVKAYSTHKGIPKSDLISEHRILTNDFYYGKGIKYVAKRSRSSSIYKKIQLKANRKNWSDALNKTKTNADTSDLNFTEELFTKNESYLKTRSCISGWY